jgi:hypothetical protein
MMSILVQTPRKFVKIFDSYLRHPFTETKASTTPFAHTFFEHTLGIKDIILKSKKQEISDLES